MIACLTRFSADDIAGKDLSELRESIESAIPLSPGNYNANTKRFPFTHGRIEKLIQLAEADDVDLSHSPKWTVQLGSLGGGNHFIELCLDETDRVWMFLHSGSRGVGNKIAQRHIKIAEAYCREKQAVYHSVAERDRYQLANRDLAFLEAGTPEFDRYIKDLNWAQKFAFENRNEMMDRFRQTLAHWMGVEAQRVELDRINCHHNYTRREDHGGQSVWLTRKGAVDAHEGVRAVIPGSMGTRSYIVRGKGSAEGLCSAPHGAGRRFSRSEAKKRFTVEDLAARMVGIEYRHGEQWVDEIPDAYKDIDVVMADAADLVEIEHELRQILNVKGT